MIKFSFRIFKKKTKISIIYPELQENLINSMYQIPIMKIEINKIEFYT